MNRPSLSELECIVAKRVQNLKPDDCAQSCYCFLMPEKRLWPVSIKGVLFIDKKVVLLLNDRGEWELPGGRLEKGKTPKACLQRELNEELGWTVEVGELLPHRLTRFTPSLRGRVGLCREAATHYSPRL